MRPAFGSHFGPILGQCFDHDSAFGERSQIISGIYLCIVLLCIFRDGSGLGLEPWLGHLFAPELGNWVSSWESREMVENKNESSQNELPYSGNS